MKTSKLAIYLDMWSLVVKPDNPYMAPELMGRRLSGLAVNHPRLGTNFVTTSTIHKVIGRLVITNSGTIYKLGAMHPKYKQFLRKNNIKVDRRNPIKEVGNGKL